jgi:membrane protease YdiL (CAAX protease family)
MNVPPTLPGPIPPPLPFGASAPSPAPGVATRPDPGSRRASRWAWVVLIGASLAVFAWQQYAVLQSAARASRPAPADEPLVGDFDPATMMARMMVRLAQLVPQSERGQLLGQVTAGATTPAERVAIAPVAGELGGAEAAIAQLELAEQQLASEREKAPDTPTLAQEIGALRTLYAPGGKASDLSPEQRELLRTRLGWLGRLALTHNDPDPAERDRMLGGGALLLVMVVLLMLGIVVGLISGSILLLVGFVRYLGGHLTSRMVPPAPGGSVCIEVAAVFAASFLLLKVVAELLEGSLLAGKTGADAQSAAITAQALTLGLQWLILPLVLLWPVLRGMPRAQAYEALGLTRGRGVLREIGAGFIGWLACIPLLFAGVVVTLVLVLIWTAIRSALGMPEARGPVNPLLELFAGHWLLVVLVMVLATVWAPLVEETVFRGGLLRALHGKLPILAAGVLTALVFSFMHGYPLIMMGPLVSLATGFALLRWWRGSIIAPIVAHALHNAVVTGLLLMLTGVLG